MGVELVFIKIKNANEAGTRNTRNYYWFSHICGMRGRVLEELQTIAVKNKDYDANSDVQCIGT